jgi:serine/threonine protein kinase
MSACPPREQLQALEAGELSDAAADTLLAHVRGCAPCAETLERLRREDLDARVVRTAVGQDSTVSLGSARAGMGAADRPADEVWNIPDYTRVQLCGEGAFGTVWAVRDRVGVYRALKTIDLSRLRASNVKCRESAALETYCRLVQWHPNLIEVFHVGMQGDLLYYTMELADDDASRTPVRSTLPKNYRPLTLQQVMERGPIGVETALEVVLRLLRGLSRLHASGLAHRDIKPANIIFVERQPKLADIGMITTDMAGPSQVGTPDYMPPDRRMDPTADTYAMGRVLYELLGGRRGSGFPKLPLDVLHATDKWDMDGINAVSTRACAPLASERFQHANQMLEAIEACRRLPLESLFADLGEIETAAGQTRRSRLVPIAVAAIHALPWVLLLLLALLIVEKLL